MKKKHKTKPAPRRKPSLKQKRAAERKALAKKGLSPQDGD